LGERERAARFVFPEVRRAFVQGRLFLRRALGRILERDPASLAFSLEGNGKPVLNERALAFNLSHSGGEAVLAFSPTGPVGVDIEIVERQRDLEGLAQRYFAAEEYAALMTLPSDQRAAAFYRCWTRKEAFIKALGEGLSHPLDAFAVTFVEQAPPTFVRLDRGETSAWRLFDLDVGGRFAGAVVVPSSITRLTRFALHEI
jgi:4'-phosphopantetheinyl transferase